MNHHKFWVWSLVVVYGFWLRTQLDVVIYGMSLSGWVLASLLHQRGYRVLLVAPHDRLEVITEYMTSGDRIMGRLGRPLSYRLLDQDYILPNIPIEGSDRTQEALRKLSSGRIMQRFPLPKHRIMVSGLRSNSADVDGVDLVLSSGSTLRCKYLVMATDVVKGKTRMGLTVKSEFPHPTYCSTQVVDEYEVRQQHDGRRWTLTIRSPENGSPHEVLTSLGGADMKGIPIQCLDDWSYGSLPTNLVRPDTQRIKSVGAAYMKNSDQPLVDSLVHAVHLADALMR